MENTSKNIDMIDQFIANERKSKIWTIINIGFFCLMGILVFWLAWSLNKTNAKYKNINIQLGKTQDSLKYALTQLDAYNTTLKQDSFSLSTRAGNYDSLKKVLDTVVLLYKESQANSIDKLTATADGHINFSDSPGESNNKGTSYIKPSQNIKNIIVDPVKIISHQKPAYTIYMHCMPGYERITSALSKQLVDKKYIIPGQEVIKGITFNPVVKYFNDDDAEEAKKIAALINSSGDFFSGTPAKVLKLDLKSPENQLEIWIGKFQQKDIHQLIKQSY